VRCAVPRRLCLFRRRLGAASQQRGRCGRSCVCVHSAIPHDAVGYPVSSPTLNRMMESIRADCPGALDDAIRRMLFSCLREMLQISDVWTNTISLPVVAGKTSYVVSPSDDGNVNRLMWVYDANQTPVQATMAVPGTLVLRYPPNVDGTYQVTLALTVIDPV